MARKAETGTGLSWRGITTFGIARTVSHLNLESTCFVVTAIITQAIVVFILFITCIFRKIATSSDHTIINFCTQGRCKKNMCAKIFKICYLCKCKRFMKSFSRTSPYILFGNSDKLVLNLPLCTFLRQTDVFMFGMNCSQSTFSIVEESNGSPQRGSLAELHT